MGHRHLINRCVLSELVNLFLSPQLCDTSPTHSLPSSVPQEFDSMYGFTWAPWSVGFLLYSANGRLQKEMEGQGECQVLFPPLLPPCWMLTLVVAVSSRYGCSSCWAAPLPTVAIALTSKFLEGKGW